MNTDNRAVKEMFSHFRSFMQDDKEKREAIKTIVSGLDEQSREILADLQQVHHIANDRNIKEVCTTVAKRFSTLLPSVKQLSGTILANEYYRFHDHWRVLFQRLVFIRTFLSYLTEEKLISQTSVCEELQIFEKKEQGFHLDLDDYLIGVLMMAGELPRLCTNSVIAGDYARTLRVSRFLGELDCAFRMLNLKNDSLRKRFDGLKYNLKKVEEVVYDLSVRGLVTNE